jgi:hypothetical protein
MATAKKHTIITNKVVEVKTSVVQLEVTEDEARAVMAVLDQLHTEFYVTQAIQLH